MAVLASAALAISACSVTGGLADAGSAPTRPTGTSTSEASEFVERAKPDVRKQVFIYLTNGELLKRVTRSVPDTSRLGAEAVKLLLAGPTRVRQFSLPRSQPGRC